LPKPVRHRLRIPNDVALLIRGMHPELKRKIRGAFEIIIATPESGKALKDELKGLRSFRVGKFRVVYKVPRRMIEIVAVGPRSKIYEETLRLIRTKSD
jgi:mRNA interferase RelE/StbE